ncbi:MAG: transglycosylase SLT domain-containing protein [Candidatus Contendobacter sp.]|nr:transglycosylase SLT domain-containing protein [Candidatus Contendobacter sp.]
MNQPAKEFLMALLLAAPASGWAEGSWLDAEVRAQEARWAAQQGRTAPLPPVGTAALPAPAPFQNPGPAARRERMRERALAFPGVAARAPRLQPAGETGVRPPFPTGSAPRPVPDEGIAPLLLARARQHQIDPLLIRAVMLTESDGQPHAISPKGARGLMQLMPATAARFGVTHPDDPDQNITGGARYLRWLLDRYGGNIPLALAGYNAGEGTVDRHGGIPPYRETQNYVRKVRSTYQWLSRRVADKLAQVSR